MPQRLRVLLSEAYDRMMEDAKGEARKNGEAQAWLSYVAEPDWFEEVRSLL